MNATEPHSNRITEQRARALDVRAAEAALLAATISMQRAGGQEGLVTDLAVLHQRAGAERRAIEAAADVLEQGAAA
jgi:hypothetical protein